MVFVCRILIFVYDEKNCIKVWCYFVNLDGFNFVFWFVNKENYLFSGDEVDEIIWDDIVYIVY